MSQPSITEILSIVRRYAEAIVEGRIAAKEIINMSDEQLADFDRGAFDRLSALQAEAEDLAQEGTEK
jgi:hypothetical protein